MSNEEHLANQLRRIISRAQSMEQNDNEVFFARQSGIYQGALNEICDQLDKGKSILEITVMP